jgi:hypothetical protein
MKVNRDELWQSPNQTEFYVDDVRDVDGERWIYYTNTFTKQTYSCLELAFIERFQPILNRSYR